MKTKFISIIVVLTLIASLASFVPVSAERRDYQLISESFDGNEWVTVTPDSNTYRGFNIQGGKEYTVLSESGRGKVISMDAGEYLGINILEREKVTKVSMTFDIKLSDASKTLPINIRGKSSSESKDTVVRMRNGYLQLNGSDEHALVSDSWYTMKFTLDFEHDTFDFMSVDSGGQTLCNRTGLTMGISAYEQYRYVRISPSSSYSGTVYIDNFSATETIDWPSVASVKDASGSTAVDYTGDTVVVETTQPLEPGTINKSLLAVTSVRDGKSISVESASVSGNQLCLTLGSPLKSSSPYQITLSGDILMDYGSVPLGEELTAAFTTSSRELDITDVSFTGNGGTVSYELSFANTTGTSQSIILVASSFDAEGRLTSTVFQPVTVASGASIPNAQGSITVPQNGSIKVFAIKDYTTLNRLNNSIYTYSLN